MNWTLGFSIVVPIALLAIIIKCGWGSALERWADFLGIQRHVLRDRLGELGWCVENALSKSVEFRKSQIKKPKVLITKR